MMIRLFPPFCGVALFCLAMFFCGVPFAEAADVTSSLGLPTKVNDFYVPGEKAEPIPRKNRESSLVIRVLDIKPAADGFRYDLEIYGMDAGVYRLSDYFHYTGSNAPLPNLPTQIEITTAHVLEGIPKPKELASAPPEKLGGYRMLLTVLIILWGIIFLMILFYRKKKTSEDPVSVPLPTLHEKLKSLVCTAAQGDLDSAERSKLERLIIGHWKQKLPAIEALPASEALSELRRHPEASPLLLKLEYWLHSPDPSVNQEDITQLLEPFREV